MSAGERVLFVSADAFGHASEKQFVGFAQELLRRGHGVMFSVGGDPASAAREGVDAIAGLRWQHHTFSGRRLHPDALAAVRAFAPDVVHALSPRVPTLAAAREMARATSARLVVHFSDDEWGSERKPVWEPWRVRAKFAVRRVIWRAHPPLWWLSTRTTLAWTRREAHALDALTPALAREVEARLGRPCHVVLPVTPRLTAPATHADAPEPLDFGDGAVALFTGTVWPVYLPDFVLGIRAIGELHRRGREITFVHAGRFHPEMDPAALLAQAGVRSDRAHLLGHLPFHRMDGLMAAATVLLQPGPPSRFNRLRLPSKMQAYLASGVPTVTFATGFAELLADREEVLMTHGDDPAELADRIEELLDDRALYERLREGGPAAAARLFDPVANTDALLRVYRDA